MFSATRHTGFFSGSQGRLLVTLYLPDQSNLPSHWLLHLPAFADEMNKSRALVAQQARQLAERGWGVLIPDLYGCGDSAGDLSVASWSLWLEDLHKLMTLLQQHGVEHLSLWGLRMGCLLAPSVLQHSPLPIERLIFWQPVLEGRQAMTQFLRLRVAAGLLEGTTETVSQLREDLQRGETMEVAGYSLSSSLFTEIDEASITDDACLAAFGGRDQPLCVEWLEVARQRGRGLLPASRACVDIWQGVGARVSAQQVVGDGFWAATELVEVPSLLQATTEALCHGELVRNAPAIGNLTPLTGRSTPFTDRPTGGLLKSLFSCTGLAEEAFNIPCQGHNLLGILHRPAVGLQAPTRGVLVVVGGPQYRVGSHRQFLLLARHLASAGIPVMRFDYRGMGDSPSVLRGFQGIDEDIAAALSAFQRQRPQLTEFVLWGLCDGATAALKFAARDTRVRGLVLLNPWIHSESGAARAYLKYYYGRRLCSPDFWRSLTSGQVRIGHALASLWRLAWTVIRQVLLQILKKEPRQLLSKASRRSGSVPAAEPVQPDEQPPSANLVDQWLEDLQAFKGRLLLVISGQDLTAKEFDAAVQHHRELRRLLQSQSVTRVDMAAADHTFSRRVWRDAVVEQTQRWMQSW